MSIDYFSRRQFLTTGGIALLGAAAFRADAWSIQDRELTLYVGTYTSGKSEGIYGYHFDPLSGLSTKLQIIGHQQVIS